jgi:hypothetical protein
VDTSSHHLRNPKNILISTTERDPFADNPRIKKASTAPGPGSYEVTSSLLKPSHNILLSDKY